MAAFRLGEKPKPGDNRVKRVTAYSSPQHFQFPQRYFTVAFHLKIRHYCLASIVQKHHENIIIMRQPNSWHAHHLYRHISMRADRHYWYLQGKSNPNISGLEVTTTMPFQV